MRPRKVPSVVDIIAKGLPYTKDMRENIARDIYAEMVATGYQVTFVAPEVPRVPSAHLAHYRKRNIERIRAVRVKPKDAPDAPPQTPTD